MNKHYSHSPSHRNSGQAIVIIAVALVGILAFVGLVVDFGVLLVNYAQLRKAVDAAAIAAAGQMREFTDIAAQTAAAQQFIQLNNYDPSKVTVQTCDTYTTQAEKDADPELCTTPRRKLIRVIAEGKVEFFFLPVIGFYDTTITAQAIGEAASMDVVLVLDSSESMAFFDTSTPPNVLPDGDPMKDPDQCNPLNACHPFKEVKAAANGLINRLKFPYDRVSVVYFALNAAAPVQVSNNPAVEYYNQSIWFTDKTSANNAVNSLGVYKRPTVYSDPGEPDNPAPGLSTNIGGALRLAGNQFNYQRRRDAVWIVILLTDGAANVTDHPMEDAGGNELLKWGYCPQSTWPYDPNKPPCADDSPVTRHSLTNFPSPKKNSDNVYDPYALNNFDTTLYLYDADDYAHDMADYVSCPGADADTPANSWCRDSLHYPAQGGQSAVLFAIGLGSHIQDYYTRPNGGYLLRYAAAGGYDNDPTGDEGCTSNILLYPKPRPDNPAQTLPLTTSCGNYYYANNGYELSPIFEQIASRIFTRISH